MNEIKLIETNGKKLLIAEVPEEANEQWLSNGFIHIGELQGDAFSIKLPPGSWQILGKSTELSEVQMKEICPLYEWGGYKIYTERPDLLTKDVNESYLSLLKANGIVDRNKYKKPEIRDEWSLDNFNYYKRLDQWRKAQKEVKTYLILIGK